MSDESGTAQRIPDEREQAITARLLAVCFFFSGGAGLVYEVLWSRHLHLLFGSTTESVSAVLAMFMFGLGLGGYWLGRAADSGRSPMRLYGLLEIGVGAFALVTPLLLAAARALFLATAPRLASGGFASTLLKLALAGALLVPPATLMGGTLPALVRAVGGTASRRVGLLYALNTLGAVAGTLGAGFVFIEVLGLSTTMRLTALVNIGIGALVVVRARRHAGGRLGAGEVREAASAGGTLAVLRAILDEEAGSFALAGLFASGAIVMVHEVVFTRVLGLVFGVSSYAFSLVLGVFLCGLALGAIFAHRVALSRLPTLADFARAQLAAAAVALVAMQAVPSVPRLVLYARQVPELGFAEVLGAKAVLAVLVLLPLAFVDGIGTPLLLARLAAEGSRAGRAVGAAYMVNTAGTLAGSLLAGFVLVEKWGTQGALRAAIMASVLVGLWGLLVSARAARSSLGWAAAGLAVLALSSLAARWDVMTFLLSDTRGRQPVSPTRLALEKRLRLAPADLLYFAEGREATVAVTNSGDRTLYVNGHPDASDGNDMATQVMLAAVPLSVHRAPGSVLVIGFGSGVTAATAARTEGVSRVTVVELERAVVAASPAFHHVNESVEDNPRVRIVHDDARTLLGAPPEKWDVVVSEPSNPWRAGVAGLFSTDFYRAARGALADGGVFAQWLQLYGLTEGTLRMVLRTLAESFPEVQLWWMDAGNVVVLASDRPLAVDRARVEQVVRGANRPWLLRHAWVHEPDELFGRFLLDTAGVRRFVDEGAQGGEPVPLHTDDLPLLEYAAPRGLFDADAQNGPRLLAARLSSETSLPPLLGAAPEPAALWTAVATMYRVSGRPPEARAALDRALAAAPTVRRQALGAELALETNDLRGAHGYLDPLGPSGAPAGTSADDAAYLDEMRALLAAHEHDLPRSVALLDSAGGLDGKRGVPRLRALLALGRSDDPLAQAERLLRAAHPGAAIDALDVESVYLALGDAAGRALDPARAAAVVEAAEPQGMPMFPRQKALAILFDKAHDAPQALAHARAAQATGALDPALLFIEARALLATGRLDEAAEVLARRRALAPAESQGEVPSPLLARPPAAAASPAPPPG